MTRLQTLRGAQLNQPLFSLSEKIHSSITPLFEKIGVMQPAHDTFEKAALKAEAVRARESLFGNETLVAKEEDPIAKAALKAEAVQARESLFPSEKKVSNENLLSVDLTDVFERDALRAEAKQIAATLFK